MLSIRADEHRYLVSADPREAALLRTIPGVRQLAANGALQAPRQPGTILALDALFGDDGWSASSDLSTEVAEARQREHPPAAGEAMAELEGKEISITCQYGDKELVKLVPGYRWSAAQRRWFLPAQPMALRILARYFGAKLSVSEGVREYLALKEIDERTAIERASQQPAPTPPVPFAANREPASVLEQALEAAEAAAERPSEGQDALLERLDRLAGAVEELVALLAKGSLPAVPPEPEPATELPPEPATESDWRQLLASIDRDPVEVREQGLRMAQTATPENEPAYRAVVGLAMVRLGEHAEALSTLRRALERAGTLEDDLSREAAASYVTSVLALLRDECGPAGPLASEGDFRDRILDELVNDDGFDGERLGSPEARSRLDYLVNDPVLRRIAPALSDYVRMAHLLGVARGGQWMAATRITDILREQTLGDEGFALALVLLANALNGQTCVNDWDKAWPEVDVAETLQDLSWLVDEAERRLRSPSLSPGMAEAAALSCLACIAGGPVEWASNAQRKALVQLISLRHSSRREYAEFLAAFQPAAAGYKSVLGLFPGWARVLAQTRLARSASYLMDVAANDNGGSGSLTWALAEDVYLQALRLWGIDDAQSEVIDLLDLLEGGKRPDNYLNEAGRLIEDRQSRWTNRVSREQRKTLYRRALEAALKEGHDRDTLEAFDRLVRELLDEGATGLDEVLSMCVRLSTAMRAVREPALEVLLGLQLENGLPFEQTAEQLMALRGQSEDAGYAIAGLFHLFPQFKEWWESARPTEVELSDSPVSFPGKRVMLIGGHKWLEQRAKPVLEGEWQMKVTWLDPDQAERGDGGIEKARNADLVVINAACIGHSASGRIGEAAKSAGVPVVTHHLRGAGALLARLAHELETRAAVRA